MSERFFVDGDLALGTVVIEGPEAHHLATVCRSTPGDRLVLFNGDGREYGARVVNAERRRVTVHVDLVEQPARELPFSLEVAVPLPKGDRAEFLVEKLTELGVTRLVPLATERSVVHPREGRLDKLRRQAIEASKQCGRNVLMRIEPLTSWTTYCQKQDLPALRILAHAGATAALPIAPAVAPADPVALAVGPEGGFREDEIAVAENAGWRLVDLGPRILRIETAALLLVSWATTSRSPLSPPLWHLLI
jgi:16S rRNA (uracil1498-N3)-methyltransferase